MIDVRNSSFRGLAGRAGSIGKCPGEGVIVLYLARAIVCAVCVSGQSSLLSSSLLWSVVVSLCVSDA